jgi:hypothetical protein
MATKDTRPAAMADSGSHPPWRWRWRWSLRPPANPACHLPGYGPAGGQGRAQALLDLLAAARAERARSRRGGTQRRVPPISKTL